MEISIDSFPSLLDLRLDLQLQDLPAWRNPEVGTLQDLDLDGFDPTLARVNGQPTVRPLGRALGEPVGAWPSLRDGSKEDSQA